MLEDLESETDVVAVDAGWSSWLRPDEDLISNRGHVGACKAAGDEWIEVYPTFEIAEYPQRSLRCCRREAMHREWETVRVEKMMEKCPKMRVFGAS